MSAASASRAVAASSAWSRTADRLSRFRDSDVVHNFRHSPAAVVTSAVLALLILAALFAPLVAPYDPFDLTALSILDGSIPPVFAADGQIAHILGTDEQGRDLLSAILYGLRVSGVVALSALAFSLAVGITAGLVSGYRGGWVDALVMRITDVKLSFPTLLIALLVSGTVATFVPRSSRDELQVYILIFAIGFGNWPKFARVVRAGVLVEKHRDYVLAARVIGISDLDIALKHILPNVLPALLVISTLTFGHAVVEEATISFLGVGLPASEPSLGTLVRFGTEALYGGEWWVSVFPMAVLLSIVLSINVFGDWLRDALNVRSR